MSWETKCQVLRICDYERKSLRVFFFIGFFFGHSNSNVKHELLNRLPRRLLKSDALPTLFAHNLAKELQKPRTSLLREETAAKWQLCEVL